MQATAQDEKYGTIAAENGEFHEDEPVVLFRAQDAKLLEVLDGYAELCNGLSPPEHLANILNSRQRVQEWQDAHPELVKVPD